MAWVGGYAGLTFANFVLMYISIGLNFLCFQLMPTQFQCLRDVGVCNCDYKVSWNFCSDHGVDFFFFTDGWDRVREVLLAVFLLNLNFFI